MVDNSVSFNFVLTCQDISLKLVCDRYATFKFENNFVEDEQRPEAAGVVCTERDVEDHEAEHAADHEEEDGGGEERGRGGGGGAARAGAAAHHAGRGRGQRRGGELVLQKVASEGS